MPSKETKPAVHKEIRAISIEEIAQQGGVSIATVSMVLNGKGDAYRISKDTQHRITELAKKLNYVANPSARNLRMQRSHAIGFVVADLSNFFFVQLAKHLEKICQENGYLLHVSDSGDNEEREEKLIRNFVAQSIDGLILASSHLDSAFLSDIARNTPTVFVDRKVKGPHCSWITGNNYESTTPLVQKLLETSPREVAYIGGIKDISSNSERRSAYKDVLKAADYPVRNTLILEQDYSTEWGAQAMEKIQERLGRNPDALFTASYTLLEGALRTLKAKSGVLPDDISIATYDDHPLLDFIRPPIHSIEQDYQEIARRSFAALTQKFSGNKAVVRETAPAKVHIRGTRHKTRS